MSNSSSASNGLIPPSQAPAFNLTLPSVDLFKSTCTEAFSEFPTAFTSSYFARFTTYYCVPVVDNYHVTRIIVTAAAPNPITASLAVNDLNVLRIDSQASTGSPIFKVSTAESRLLVLAPGCNKVELLFNDVMMEGDMDDIKWQVPVLDRILGCVGSVLHVTS